MQTRVGSALGYSFGTIGPPHAGVAGCYSGGSCVPAAAHLFAAMNQYQPNNPASARHPTRDRESWRSLETSFFSFLLGLLSVHVVVVESSRSTSSNSNIVVFFAYSLWIKIANFRLFSDYIFSVNDVWYIISLYFSAHLLYAPYLTFGVDRFCTRRWDRIGSAQCAVAVCTLSAKKLEKLYCIFLIVCPMQWVALDRV